MLGHEVQDHLPVDRGHPEQPGQAPVRHQAVLGGETVAAVRLHGRVHRGDRGFRRRVLGHVRRLAGRLAVVVLPARLPGHQPGQLGLDLGPGQRVSDTLVGADRGLPHLAFGGVPGRPSEHEAGDAHAGGGAGNALRVQPVEHLAEALALAADQRLRSERYSVEMQRELLLRQHQVDRQHAGVQPRRVGGHDEQGQLRVATLIGAGPRDDQQRLGLVHPGDVVLGAAQPPAGTVSRRFRGQPVGVRAGVRLGDREHHLGRAGGQPGQPRLALLVGAELGDHPGRDGRRDEQQQQRRALRAEFLADQGQFGQPAATTAVGLGDVDPNESGFTKLGPQLIARRPRRGVAGVVLRPKAPGYGRDSGSQVAVLGGLSEIHACSIEVIADSLGL